MATGTAARSARAIETRRAAGLSVVSNTLLTVSKLVAGLATGSISVISEAVHSGNDLVAALLAFFSVRKSNEPADEHHRYGHGKYEALSGLIEAMLIVVAALSILYTAVRSMIKGQYEELNHAPALAVMAFSMVMNIIVSRTLYRVGRKHESIALEADAAHLSTDVWTSAGVFVGLALIYVLGLFGYDVHWLDPALAVFVAALVLTQGWRISRDALEQLLDSSLPIEDTQRIVGTLQEHYGRFVNFHRLRSRRAGHERYIDLHLVVCDRMTVAEAHEFTDHLEADLAGLFPSAQVLIHIEPCDDEECRAKRVAGNWDFCVQEKKRAQGPTDLKPHRQSDTTPPGGTHDAAGA
ncbi:cation diffusion facilitator family transporter [bacterium]|nr:cation diffusion facilitator family transporter [bacterium]